MSLNQGIVQMMVKRNDKKPPGREYHNPILPSYKERNNPNTLLRQNEKRDNQRSSEKCFLGIDIGSSSVKIFAFAGDQVYKAREQYPETISTSEQNPHQVAYTVLRSFNQLFETNGLDPTVITGIGLSGHFPSLLFIDKEGSPLTSIVTWQDQRASQEAIDLQNFWADFSKDGSSMEAKLLWFWRNHPTFFTPGVTALDPKSYIAYLLCGKRSIDLSGASNICYFNRLLGKWDTKATGIPLDVLPDIFKSWQSIGTTNTEFSRTCGLPYGIPVYLGGIDAYCESVGAGGFSNGVVVDGSGTSTCLSRPVPINPDHFLHVLPDASIQIEALSSSGACYTWFRECFKGTDLNALTESILTDDPACILFLPYLSGERSPIWDEKARGVFVGIDLNTNAATMLQALYQGVGFAIRQTLEGMGQDISRIRAVGGANRNDKWLQIKANIIGVRYERMKEHDASALGAAVIAAIGSGAFKQSHFDKFIKPERIFEPDPKSKHKYDEIYASYKALYGRLRKTFAELHDCASQN